MDSKLELRHWLNKNDIFVATYRLRFHLRHNGEKAKRKNMLIVAAKHAIFAITPIDGHALRLCKSWRQLYDFTF